MWWLLAAAAAAVAAVRLTCACHTSASAHPASIPRWKHCTAATSLFLAPSGRAPPVFFSEREQVRREREEGGACCKVPVHGCLTRCMAALGCLAVCLTRRTCFSRKQPRATMALLHPAANDCSYHLTAAVSSCTPACPVVSSVASALMPFACPRSAARRSHSCATNGSLRSRRCRRGARGRSGTRRTPSASCARRRRGGSSSPDASSAGSSVAESAARRPIHEHRVRGGRRTLAEVRGDVGLGEVVARVGDAVALEDGADERRLRALVRRVEGADGHLGGGFYCSPLPAVRGKIEGCLNFDARFRGRRIEQRCRRLSPPVTLAPRYAQPAIHEVLSLSLSLPPSPLRLERHQLRPARHLLEARHLLARRKPFTSLQSSFTTSTPHMLAISASAFCMWLKPSGLSSVTSLPPGTMIWMTRPPSPSHAQRLQPVQQPDGIRVLRVAAHQKGIVAVGVEDEDDATAVPCSSQSSRCGPTRTDRTIAHNALPLSCSIIDSSFW